MGLLGCQLVEELVEANQEALTDEIADDHRNGVHTRGIDRRVCFAP
jgi:hypothetical protein